MKLFIPNMKMVDVIHGNYLLMPVIHRFGIPLGFGEMTVAEVCKKYRIDAEFFLAIINVFSNEHHFPEKKLQNFNILTIVDYLEKTHLYYSETQVPLIEKLLNDLAKHGPAGSKNLKLITKFFLGYKRELLAHLDREEKVTFPYIKKVYRLFHTTRASEKEKRILSKYSMHVFEEEHSDVDEKLYDLKNILIKYIHSDSMQDVYHKVIFELFRLEKDITDHTRIENKILMPLVSEMEDALYYPAEHSRRTAGKNALYRKVNSDISKVPGSSSVNKTYAVQPYLISGQKVPNKELEGLTSRELEVLQLVACGFLNKQIADKLSISSHTVISHRKNITHKLQIKTVAGLTIYALMNGLISSKNIN